MPDIKITVEEEKKEDGIVIDKVPSAAMITDRIFRTISMRSDIERELVLKILSEWNDNWIELIAEMKSSVTDNSEQIRKTNQQRLDDRLKRLKSMMMPGVPAKLREDTV